LTACAVVAKPNDVSIAHIYFQYTQNLDFFSLWETDGARICSSRQSWRVAGRETAFTGIWSKGPKTPVQIAIVGGRLTATALARILLTYP